MNTDLIMFIVGMSMALAVSLGGMLLAWYSYAKRQKESQS